MQISEEQHETIQKILDQIESMMGVSYDVTLLDIQRNMEQSRISNEDNFTKELDFSSQEIVNKELLRKTRKVGGDNDDSKKR